MISIQFSLRFRGITGCRLTTFWTRPYGAIPGIDVVLDRNADEVRYGILNGFEQSLRQWLPLNSLGMPLAEQSGPANRPDLLNKLRPNEAIATSHSEG